MLFKSSRYAVMMLLVAVLGSVWILVSREPEGANAATRVAPQKGFFAPEFTLERLERGQASLSDFKGKVVLLNFWATWCPPCRAEMPAIQHVADQYAGDGLVVLLVNQAEDRATIKGYLDTIGVTAPVLLDTKVLVASQYRVRALPTTFFIDRQGRVADVTIGGPMTEAYLRSRVEPLLRRP